MLQLPLLLSAILLPHLLLYLQPLSPIFTSFFSGLGFFFSSVFAHKLTFKCSMLHFNSYCHLLHTGPLSTLCQKGHFSTDLHSLRISFRSSLVVESAAERKPTKPALLRSAEGRTALSS